jgi:hypothetical protein
MLASITPRGTNSPIGCFPGEQADSSCPASRRRALQLSQPQLPQEQCPFSIQQQGKTYQLRLAQAKAYMSVLLRSRGAQGSAPLCGALAAVWVSSSVLPVSEGSV